MITKNQNYGISKNVTIADFGDGDIRVASAHIESDNVGCVLFENHTKRPIGTDHPETVGKTTDELPIDLALRFSKTESIDVVIKALKNAKKYMIEEKNNCQHQWSYLSGSPQNETMRCKKCGVIG